jgi:IS30 family transposase
LKIIAVYENISVLLDAGNAKRTIAKQLNVSPATFYRVKWIERNVETLSSIIKQQVAREKWTPIS